jgi:spore maturation protein CgeB
VAPDNREDCILAGDVRLTASDNAEYSMDLRDPQNNGTERKARICMATWRGFSKAAFRCGLYEAQDVLMEIDDVDLISLEPGRMFRFKERWQRRLLWRDVTRKLIYVNPGLHPFRLEREYDLFVVVCQSWADLLYLNAVKGWKDHCRISVCYIDELWAREIPNNRYWMHRLMEFDHVILGLRGSVAAVEKKIGRACHYVPGGVDAIRFSPYPEPPERVIDVYSIGRRWEGVHQRFLQLAAERKIFYMYDTFYGASAADVEVSSHRQHREFLANAAKRSRFFQVGPAKMDSLRQTGGQIEIGYRFFEGAAAGAVLIGQVARCESFERLFNWPDAVIEIQPDGSDVLDVLSALAAEPERLEAMSRRNAAEALLRYDWVYRWRHILEIAGVKPTMAMEARETRLSELAEMARAST